MAIDEDDDDGSITPEGTLERQDGGGGPQAATPDQDEREEIAAAAAEISVMGGRDDAQGQQTMTDSDEMEMIDESGELVQQAFLQFLQEFKHPVERNDNDADDNGGGDDDEDEGLFLRPYAEQAESMARRRRSSDSDDDGRSLQGFTNTLMLNFKHVIKQDPELADAIQGEFCRFEPYLKRAVKSFCVDKDPILADVQFFLGVYNFPTTRSVRQLRTDVIGALSSVTGTITRTSDVRPELLVANFCCVDCGTSAGNVQQQYCYTRPVMCKSPRCKNTSPLKFILKMEKSQFVDWQKLRVQENSDQIPPGSMPRSMDVVLRNEMVEKCKAGDKCVFVGSLVVIPDGSALARAGETPVSSKVRPSDAATGGGGGVQGFAALGVRELTYRTCFVATSVLPAEAAQSDQNERVMASLLYGKETTGIFSDVDPTSDQVAMELTTAQRAEIRAIRSSPRLYDQMVDSIAPSTFGHREVKKGMLLLLLGGVHKTTPDGIRLRGDVNVCIIGDPSTAKSQFLKFVHSFLPDRSVYTSGKASSAAGLTAAVQRDQDTGEFCIEAGALMLADNGICCIDEFDKMDPHDQVAIHEAMEQQTISITKAGIQATLNARASILAAANPIYGRYDRTKTLKANVALSAPILSRFDLFFVVLDECNVETDRMVASHILRTHRSNKGLQNAVKPPFSIEQMRRYIKFVRTINPKLTRESQRVMIECYRKLRQGDTLGRSRSAYRITVRQLESMMRLSEGLARLHCSDEIQPSYVREAYRLLKTSIIQVETSDVEVDDDDDDDEENYEEGGPNPEMASDAEEEKDGDEEMDQDESQPAMETQPLIPADYGLAESTSPPSNNQKTSGDSEMTAAGADADTPDAKSDSADVAPKTTKKKKKKKTKISFEEYQSITHAIAGHLRAIESDDNPYLTWQQTLDWYLEQCEDEIGTSLDQLEEVKKKVNLVIRRLIDVDRILVTVGELPKRKKDQGTALLAVHPNYEPS